MHFKFDLTMFLIFSILSVAVDVDGRHMKSEYFLRHPMLHGDAILTRPEPVNGGILSPALHGQHSRLIEKLHHHKASSPIRLLKGRSGNDVMASVLEVYQKNYREVIDKAIKLLKQPQDEDFTSQLDHCKDEMETCLHMSENHGTCATHCLASANPTFNAIADIIWSQVEYLCHPIHSAFDTIFDFQATNYSQFQRFRKYLDVFKGEHEELEEIALHAATALLPMIIYNSPTNMLPFRAVKQSLEEALQAEEIKLPVIDTLLSNRLCLAIDNRGALIKLMEALYKDHNLVDIVLGGLATMNQVSKYIPGHFQLPFAVTVEGIRLMGGSTCGLIELLISDGENALTCDQLGGYPYPGIPIPPAVGIPIDSFCTDGAPPPVTIDENQQTPPPEGKERKKRSALERESGSFGLGKMEYRASSKVAGNMGKRLPLRVGRVHRN